MAIPTIYMAFIDMAKRTSIDLDTERSRTYHIEANGPHPEPTVLACGYQKCLPAYHIKRTRFKPFVAEYVVRGRGYLETNSRSVELSEGMMFVYGGGEPHAYWADADDPMEKIHIAFSGKGSEGWIRRAAGQTTGAISFTAPGEIADLFERALLEASSIGRNRNDILRAYLRIILMKAEALRAGGGREPSAGGVYHAAKATIESQFLTLKSANEVSGALGVSLPHLCRLFKQHADTSPHSYLVQLKLNHAAQLLGSTGRSVKEIAYDLSFTDPYHFSRSFKKRFGKSPRHFREDGL